MSFVRSKQHSRVDGEASKDPRLRLVMILVYLFTAVLIARLFVLMILEHSFYTALAAGSHEMYEQLFPERGSLYIQDSRSHEEFPIALNKESYSVYADTRMITDDETAELVAEELASVFAYDDEKKFQVYLRLNKRDDPYEPLEQRVDVDVVELLKSKALPGIGYVRSTARYYPEGALTAHVTGFVGKDADGNDIGSYGIEGYWQETLAGSGGFLSAEKSAAGRILPLAEQFREPAEDGADILLTIDRAIQYYACERLRTAFTLFEAQSATLVILNPKTGAVLAMCSFPDFDPNIYNEVASVDVYNNTAIYEPYEPGSIFKPIAVAAAIDDGAVTPETTFVDTGQRAGICQTPIKNADFKVFDKQNVTNILENSINTGMVFVVEQLGKQKFVEYLEQFGFGTKEGLQLATENTGTLETLSVNKKNAIDCYAATASFGQGITATPLQMVSAFTAIANGGVLLRPYIVEEVRYPDGNIDRIRPKEVRQVISSKSASLLSAMLVSVVDNGSGSLAQVPGYYLAGKTGTGQIAGKGGYTEFTNHSFAGFGPVEDPVFVAVIKLSKPTSGRYASITTAPIFKDIAAFILDYYGVAPSR